MSQFSLFCVLTAEGKKDSVGSQLGAQEIHLYWISTLEGPLDA